MFHMGAEMIRTAITITTLLALAGCTGTGAPAAGKCMPAAQAMLAGLPAPLDVLPAIRNTAATPRQRLRYGSELLPGAQWHQHATAGTGWQAALELAPTGTGGGTDALAWALYSFTLPDYGALDGETARFTAQYSAPAGCALWLGVADWQSGGWQWYAPGPEEPAALGDAVQCFTADGGALVCALATGSGSVQLNWLGLGSGLPPQQPPLFYETLPAQMQASVLWQGDVEEGSLWDWEFTGPELAGGGVFNTGGGEVTARATDVVAHTGGYSAEATITNAYRAENGNRAVRLMRWTDKPWDEDGGYLPADCCFSTFMYFPYAYDPTKHVPWDPGDGGWWNVFQFKSDDAEDVSQPVWVLNVDYDADCGFMYFYLYSNYNAPHSFVQAVPLPIPVRQWVHVEARYVQSASGAGSVTVWQDGTEIFSISGVDTILAGNATWGIGNYTDHIAGGPVEGEASVYFDDCIISTQPVHSAVRAAQ